MSRDRHAYRFLLLAFLISVVAPRADAIPDSWVVRAVTPAAVGAGARLVATRSGPLFALRGAATTTFYRYDRGTNAWTTVRALPAVVNAGSALVYPGNRGEYIFAARGGAADFLRYTITLDTWQYRASAPGAFGDGAAAAWAGDDTVYMHQGGGAAAFYRYDIGANAWTVEANDGHNRGVGAGLAWPGGDTIYSVVGNGTQRFHAYYRPTASWVTAGLESMPVVPGAGASLASAGSDTLYFLAGGGDTRLFRYRIEQNAWDTMTGVPIGVTTGGALAAIWEGDTYLFALAGLGTGFYRYELSDSEPPALASTASSMVVPPGVSITESVTVVVTDADENRTGLAGDEAIFVRVTNRRTGESEVLRLFEQSVMGSFGGSDTLPFTTNTAVQVSGDNRLHVLAGDTIAILYADPDDAIDTVQGLVFPYHDSVASGFLKLPVFAGVGDSLSSVVVRDTDQNFRGIAVETVLVRVVNNRTAETEAWTLFENGTNAGYFGLVTDSVRLSVDAAFSATGDGRLFALAGDTLTVYYDDPSGGSDSSVSGLITALHDSTASVLVAAPSALKPEDSAYAIVRDTDQNLDAFLVETITVYVVNNRTGESESRSLTENGANAGYFGSLDETIGVTADGTFAGSGNGRLFALAGDTLRMFYRDPTGGSDSASSATFFYVHDATVASCTFATQARIGDSVSAIVIDTDQNFFGGKRETVSILAVNNRTGEQETFTLQEQSVNAGYFGGAVTDTLRVVIDATYAGSGNGRMYALAGDTLTLIYTDPTDPTDTVASGPIPVFHDSAAAAMTSPGNRRISDSLTVVVRDSDQNFNAFLVETIAVEFRNNRTGETESLSLNEVSAGAGYFGGVDTLILSTDAADGVSDNDSLYVLAGDSIQILYTDPTMASDTVAVTITILPTPVAAFLVDSPARIRLGDSVTAVLRDSDQNLSATALESVPVSVRNMRTGEQETWTLTENTANAGYFGLPTDTMMVTLEKAYGGSGNGRLYALAGDTIRIQYVDPDNTPDSLSSALFAAYHESVVSAFTVTPTWAVVGDSLFGAVLRDTDQDFFGTRRETIVVEVVHQRTGETESWTLTEDTPTSAHFGSTFDSIGIRQDAGEAASGSGRVYAVAGDTLRVLYTDPTDSADTSLTALITVRHDTTTSVVIAAPASAKIADSITAILRDTDQNFSGLGVETVTLVVTNMRTGETETLTASEPSANAGYFGGGGAFGDTVPVTIDATFAASGDGRLRALAGDTLRITYTDPNHPADSVATGLFAAYHDTGASAMAHPVSARLGESLTAIVTDTDQNFSGLRVETVAVVVTNNRTGETERLVLTEVGANGGYFGGTDTLPIDTNAAVAASGSGRLHALAGDTITILYTDPTGATDTVASALIATYFETGVSSLVWFPGTITVSDSVAFALRDSDQNFLGTRLETVSVVVRNNRSLESEILVLTEVGANGGHFGGNDTLPLSSLTADSASISGKLYVLVGDTLDVSYADPSGGVDTLAVTITVVPDPTPSAVHANTPSAKLFDSVTVTIRDTDQNFSGTKLETVPILFTNMRTGETETIVLNENGANAGYFGLPTDTLPVTMDISWIASGNGRIFLLAGDTLTGLYTDPNDLSDTVRTAPIQAYHDSITSLLVFMPTIAAIYDSVSSNIRDTDQNFWGLRVETVTVVVTNNRTGETEVLVLTETIANAGYFGGNDTLPIVIDTTFGGSGNGRLYAVAGDTLTIRYTDPTDSTDTQISPTFIGVYHDSAPAIGIYQPSVRLFDSVTAIIHDSDQNHWGLYQETVLVSFRNTRTNEVETRVLGEVGVNAGYFGGTETRAVTMDITFNATGNGILFMLAGDTLLVTYVDPTMPSDSITSPPIQAYHDSVFATLLVSSPSAKLYDSITMRVLDTDQNFFGTRTETVPFSILNARTGEIETFVLTESGANAGYWGLPTDTAWVTMDATFAASGNGRLYALAGDTIVMRYHDPSGPPDSVAAAGITAFHDTVASAWVFYPPAVEITDSFRVIVRDTDQNFQGLQAETVLVTFTVTRTGETETLILREPNANAGYFGLNDTLPVTVDATWIASGNGRLHVVAGDTVRVVYRDPTDTTDTIYTPFIGVYHDSVPATWVVPTVTRYDDSVIAYIRDTDQNFYGTEIDTVWITVTNNRTGEVETLVLRESGVNGGYFGQPGDTLPVTRLVIDAPSGSGRLYALGGDSLTIRYVDPSDPTDSLTGTVDLISWYLASEPLGSGLGLYTGALEWADYDRDGDLDLAASGLDQSNAARLVVVRNDGFGVFSIASQPMGAGLGLRASALDWGDYDNDGDLDLVASGNDNTNRRLIVFRNDGAGVFTAAVEPMGANQGVDAGSVQWGDYDQDGDLDLMVMGVDNAARKRLILFRNDTGVLAPDIEPFGPNQGVSASISGATASRFGDYDNDGDLDVAVAGQDNTGFNRRFVVFQNIRNETFVAVAEPLGANLGFLDAAIDWGDYDADGDLDLLAAGSEVLGANPRLLVYRNDGGSFTLVSQPVGAGTGYSYPSARWTDLDNDGDLDFAATGLDAGGVRRFRAFRNNGGGSFSAHTEILGSGLGVAYGAMAWADWDRDGDIDIAILGQDSTSTRLVIFLDVVGYPVNVAPAAPSPVTVDGVVFGSDTITLSWTGPAGDTTPTAALTYNVRVGRTSQGVQVMSADTYAGDTTAGQVFGNVQNGETAVLYIPHAGSYTWAVQSVDGGQARSAWSAERTFLSNASICAGFFPPQARENDSMTARIIDTDQNFSAILQETVPVLVTNIRTAESEILVLRENGVNSSSFGGNDTLRLTIDVSWAASNNGRLYALAGDTLVVYYLDPDNARDSSSSPQILVRADTAISVGVYPPNLRVDDSGTATIRDSDENHNGLVIETVTVTFRNNRTGESEVLTLTERGANAGYFGGLDTLPLSGDLGQSASGSGRLFVLAGDTITIVYQDANDVADTLQSPVMTVIPDTRPSAAVFPPRLRVGDSVSAIIRDTDQNWSGLRAETVLVVVTNARTGETERITLTEQGPNGGYFGGGLAFGDTMPITIDSTFSSSQDGRLVVLAGDSLTIAYGDPDDPADSVLSASIVAYPDSTLALATYPPSLRVDDSLTVIVRDTDRNFHATIVETVVVVVTNVRSGETEVLVLRENGANGGYFGGAETLPFTIDLAHGVSMSGRMRALSGDTLTVSYQDPRDPADSILSPVMTVVPDTAASVAAYPPFLLFGDSVTAVLRDSDQNFLAWALETVSLVVTNDRTGETEILVLWERAPNSGYFGGADTLPLTLDATWSAAGDRRLVAWSGDTVTSRYQDPTDATDSSSFSARVRPVATSSAATFPPHLRVSDSLSAIVRDTDQNFFGTQLETVSILVIHQRTGETERLVLRESPANSGYFGGVDTLPLTMDSLFLGSLDGRMFMLAGDSLTFLYVDPDDPSDAIQGPNITAQHDTTASSGVFPPNLRVGDSVTAIIRDTDQNLWGLRKDLVLLVVVNNRTGEQETVTLTENAPNAGYFGGGATFGDTLLLTVDAGDLPSGDHRLYALAGDTLYLRYQDPRTASDSVSATMTVVLPDTVSSALAVPASVRTGDSVTAIIRDTDQNLQATLIETVVVTVTNTRTAETEILVLRENAANSGYFGGMDTLVLVGDVMQVASGSGRLYVLSGDTLIVRYVDPNDAFDSVTSSWFPVLPETSTVLGVFPPSLRIGDSVTAVIRDSDQNFLGLVGETVSVLVLNLRGGDSETLILQERGTNGGYFGGVETLPITADATWAASGNGRVFARPGDTVQIRYVDPTDGSDSARSANLVVFPDTASASGTFPPAIRTGDSLTGIIRDSDQNLDGLTAETVLLVVVHGRTGERETMTLAENGANAGYFGGTDTLPLTFDEAHAASGTGRLLVLSGDTIVLVYLDPTDPTDSVASATLIVRPDTSISSGVFPPILRPGDSVTAILVDSDQNRNGLLAETVLIAVTNNRTGETESMTLGENGANGGYFGGADTLPLSTSPADSVSGSGRLVVLAGDTVTIRYVDPRHPSDSTTSTAILVAARASTASGSFATTVRPLDTVAGSISDSDENRSGITAESITVSIVNARSQETEILVLRESGANAGVFGWPPDSLPLTPDATFAASGNGRLHVLAGDSVLVRYVDRDDPTDTFGATIIVIPDTTVSAGSFLPAARVGDSISAIIRDSDENRRGWQQETVLVTVSVGRTGEVETLVLRENGLNGGYFGGNDPLPFSSNASDSVSGNGWLHVLAADTIVVVYVDPSDSSDSVRSGAIVIFVETAPSRLLLPASVAFYETLTVTLVDADQNLTAFALETVVVVLRNGRTGETEGLVLWETMVNQGAFTAGMVVTRDASDSAPGSGRLYALIYDTVHVRYVDPTDSADFVESGVVVRPTFTGTIQQIHVRTERMGTDSYRIHFVPTGSSGETLPALVGVPVTVTIRDSTAGLGRLAETVAFLLPESAAFSYTRVERVTIWLEVRLLDESFYPVIQLVAAGESIPMIVSGSRDPTGPGGQVLIPGGYYGPATHQVFVEPYSDFASESPAFAVLVDAANAASANRGDRRLLIASMRPEQQFNIRSLASGSYLHALDTQISITVTYPDDNHDGYVDGTTVLETSLMLCYLDEGLGVWIAITGGRVDGRRNAVTAEVSHLTIFTLIGGSTGNTNASFVAIYPNPWRPNDGIADNGREYIAGDLSTGIIFENLPGGAKIKVLSLLGEIVMERYVSSGGTYQWDVRNQRGHSVASGQYVVVIEAPNGTRRIDKLTVIR